MRDGGLWAITILCFIGFESLHFICPPTLADPINSERRAPVGILPDLYNFNNVPVGIEELNRWYLVNDRPNIALHPKFRSNADLMLDILECDGFQGQSKAFRGEGTYLKFDTKDPILLHEMPRNEPIDNYLNTSALNCLLNPDQYWTWKDDQLNSLRKSVSVPLETNQIFLGTHPMKSKKIWYMLRVRGASVDCISSSGQYFIPSKIKFVLPLEVASTCRSYGGIEANVDAGASFNEVLELIYSCLGPAKAYIRRFNGDDYGLGALAFLAPDRGSGTIHSSTVGERLPVVCTSKIPAPPGFIIRNTTLVRPQGGMTCKQLTAYCAEKGMVPLDLRSPSGNDPTNMDIPWYQAEQLMKTYLNLPSSVCIGSYNGDKYNNACPTMFTQRSGGAVSSVVVVPEGGCNAIVQGGFCMPVANTVARRSVEITGESDEVEDRERRSVRLEDDSESAGDYNRNNEIEVKDEAESKLSPPGAQGVKKSDAVPDSIGLKNEL